MAAKADHIIRRAHGAATEQPQRRRLKDLHAQGHSTNQQLALEGMPAGIVRQIQVIMDP